MKTLIAQSLYKALVASVCSSVVIAGVYFTFEPMFAEGATSQTVTVTLNVTSGVAVTVDSNTMNMSTNLSVSQNTAVATSTFTVSTNDSLGYTFQVAASTNPAMQGGGNKIADFPTTTPQIWTSGIGNPDARFGFSVIGSDIIGSSYFGTGNYCNGAGTSTISTTLKYLGFYTAATTTSRNSSTTTPAGDNTIVCYAVNQNNTYIPSGTYTASITGTAIAN